jgi:hypothetical protein
MPLIGLSVNSDERKGPDQPRIKAARTAPFPVIAPALGSAMRAAGKADTRRS